MFPFSFSNPEEGAGGERAGMQMGLLLKRAIAKSLEDNYEGVFFLGGGNYF